MRGLLQRRREGGRAFGRSAWRYASKSPLSAVLLFLLACVAILWPGRQLRSDNFILYFPSNHALLPFETLDGTKYLAVMHVLNAVGKVTGLQEKKNALRVWFGPSLIELRPDDKRVHLEKNVINLAHPVRVANGQWLVPVDFLTTVLPHLTHQAVEYQEGTNRIFLGDVQPSSFAVRLDPLANGARLTLQFTSKVAVHTASSNGKWVLFLGDRPMEPAEVAYHFQNAYVKDLEFDDQDGLPKLVLTPASGGLNFYPVQADGGRVLVADVVKPQPTVAQIPSAPPPSTPAAAPVTAPSGGTAASVPAEQPSVAPPGPPLPVVVLDAGHGGGDTGGRSRDGVPEKELTAQFVARVRTALLATNKFRILLTRNGDTDTSVEQRALVANLSGALCFLSFHAGDLGTSARRIAVFSFGPPSARPAEASGAFVPWEQVQAEHLDQSRQLAAALQQEFSRLSGVQVDAPAAAPVRVLRNVNSNAVAVELGRWSAEAAAAPLTDPAFQQQVATAVAQALLKLYQGGT